VWRRHRARRHRAVVSAQVLEACELIAADLSAGRPPGAALAQGARVCGALVTPLEAWRLGSDVPVALRRAADLPGAADLRIVAAAWAVSHHSGHGLAHALERVCRRIRAQRATRRVVTSELASARSTARLVALLPLAALAMGAGAGGDPWHFLLDTPLGIGCLGVGILCMGLGLWWIEVIADSVEAT